MYRTQNIVLSVYFFLSFHIFLKYHLSGCHSQSICQVTNTLKAKRKKAGEMNICWRPMNQPQYLLIGRHSKLTFYERLPLR
jgi:hypothetical protein